MMVNILYNFVFSVLFFSKYRFHNAYRYCGWKLTVTNGSWNCSFNSSISVSIWIKNYSHISFIKSGESCKRGLVSLNIFHVFSFYNFMLELTCPPDNNGGNYSATIFSPRSWTILLNTFCSFFIGLNGRQFMVKSAKLGSSPRPARSSGWGP